MAVVLKNRMLGVEGLRPSRFNIADVREEADQIRRQGLAELETARTEAARILEQAKTKAEQLQAEAKEQGRKAGIEQGLAEGREAGQKRALEESRKQHAEQAAELRKSLEDLLTKFDRERHELVSRAYRDLLALALAIAEKVIRRTVEHDPEAVLASVRSAVDLVASSHQVVVRMHPVDLESLEQLDPQHAEFCAGMENVKFVADPSVERFGCLVRSAGGEVDGRIATQIEMIAKHLVPGMEARTEAWSRVPAVQEAPDAPPQSEDDPTA